MQFNFWDIAMLVGISAQATLLAYLPAARAKAVVYTMPIPFTLAFLALGKPVGVTHVSGLALILVYANGVYWLHGKRAVPIVPAIITMALLVGLTGGGLAQVLPRGRTAFWLASAFIVCLAGTVIHFQPARDEPAHRTPLPVFLKLPAVALVVGTLILAKQWLQGFMTVFPILGTVAAYEARHSLWTLNRQIPVLMLSLAAMLMAMNAVQASLHGALTLLTGWTVFIRTMLGVERYRNGFIMKSGIFTKICKMLNSES